MLLIAAIAVVVSIGGIVEIAPLFYLESTVEEVDGMRPYTPLELAGRDIYVREGCYLCHSQMVRPLRDEVERYGHYSLAAESMYDHPFQWGSKRTGPDLARVGGKYSDAWQVDHLMNPEAVVPESVMPKYSFLMNAPIDGKYIADTMATQRLVGVPYTDEMIASAKEDFAAQADPNADTTGLQARYGKDAFKHNDVTVANFDGQPALTEMDALVAYLQVLGRMVAFSTYTPDPTR